MHGRLANSVGTAQVSPIIVPSNPVFLPTDPANTHAENLIEFQFQSSGVCRFQGSAQFWNSFGIWCSPYFRELTGFPELIVLTTEAGVSSFKEADALSDLTHFFVAGDNVVAETLAST